MPSRRRERRSTYPYRVAVDALSGIALRLDDEAEYDAGQTTFDLEVESNEPATLHAQLRFELDPNEISNTVCVELDHLQLAVVEEQPFFRLNRVHGTWPIQSVPPELLIEVEPEGYGGRPFRIRAAVVLSKDLEKSGDGRAWRAGSVLSEKDFTLRVPTSKSLFHVENSSFSEKGWEKNALWFCDFHGLESAAEAQPDEVVTVHLNKDHPALQALWLPSARRHVSRRPSAAMVRALVGAGILSEVVSTLFAEHYRRTTSDGTEIEIEEGSMLELVKSSLTKGLGSSFEELVDLAGTEPGKLARQVQDMVGIGRSFSIDALANIDSLGNVGGDA